MKRKPTEDVFDEPWMKQAPHRPAGVPPPLPDEHARPDVYDATGALESELEHVLHSVHNEAHTVSAVADHETELARLIQERRAGMSPFALAAVVLLVAMLAGPVSIAGTYAAGGQGFFGILYLVAGGPVIEEMMKLGGLLYLLEKKPWYILRGWHIIAAACLSALLFGLIENMVYSGVYLARVSGMARHEIMQFRWSVTVVLHVAATFIGAIGLRKAWLATVARGRLFDSQIAEPYIAAAVIVHGGYNAIIMMFEKQMF